ncbi:hypothetical protein CC78DRAFT_122688 [Lojkania enalia]|uniref:Uncharacterized protein n=1 Tax=Lojkania enalia TaxID=147567 RepID=A0A9P4KEI1_9PLEO|nr:hypothetical protein CC78DRAFT_122688 [Didymosphaeria enalia]
MSSESLAAFRNRRANELRQLAEEHIKHDLNQSDRDTLRSAATKVSTHATIGSLVGLGLGVYIAIRLRRMRLAYFNAFKAMEKPVELKFADGRTESIPDISNQLQPSQWADAAGFFCFSIAGLFIGGEAGFLTGTSSATRTITKDPESRKRIEKAFTNYRIDAMKQEIQRIEGKGKTVEMFSEGF